jgi:hypothetical protein
MYLKVKYFEVKKEINLDIANNCCNPRQLPKRGQNIHKYLLLFSNAVEL